MRYVGSLALAAAIACMALTGGAARADADHRRPNIVMPNIVMIVSDDQSYRDFGFLGNDLVRTPHIDRLAAASARYPAGYVPMSLCRASLATLLTGLYPHQHGIHFNHPPPGYGKMRDMTAAQYRATRAQTDDLIRNAPTLPAILARRGYATLQTGKHWEGHYANAGFTHGMTLARPAGRLGAVTGTRKQTNGEWVAHGNGDAGLVIGRETMRPIRDFIDDHAGRRPFFVWYAPFLPHTPYDAPPEYERAVRANGAPPHLVPYYANVAWFDDTVGALLAILEEKALLDSTLIVFVVDNGLRPDPARPTRQDARSKYSPYEDAACGRPSCCAGTDAPGRAIILGRFPRSISSPPSCPPPALSAKSRRGCAGATCSPPPPAPKTCPRSRFSAPSTRATPRAWGNRRATCAAGGSGTAPSS